MIPAIHLLVCQNFEPELKAVLAAHPEFDSITYSIFPCRCGSPPLSTTEVQTIPPVENQVVEILGDCCLVEFTRPGSLPASHHHHVFSPCFRMFTTHELIDDLTRSGAYLITPGWLTHWRKKIDSWKFANDQDLLDFLQESAKRIVLLDTGVEPQSSIHLREFAEFARLPTETITVGLDYFTAMLTGIILRRRLELEQQQAKENVMRLNQQSADYAMALDLLGDFSRGQDEEETIHHILDVFKMLFAPQTINYVSFDEEEPLRLYALKPGSRRPDEQILQKIARLEGDNAWNESGDGFLLRVSINEETLGIIIVERIAFPEYGQHYFNLIHAILPICGLSIQSSRNYQHIKWAEDALRRANRQLKKIANIDGLTLIANRRSFDMHLRQEWQRAFRDQKPISLIMLDIDYFKHFNDNYGHQAGDECLKTTAQIVSQKLSRPGDLAARYGGEEFAIILPNTPANGSLHLANSIQNDMQEAAIPHAASKVSDYVTLSIGLATIVPDKATQMHEIIALADKALYEAKQQGRNRIVINEEDNS